MSADKTKYEIVRASKYVTDPGYRYKDYSTDSIQLFRKLDNKSCFIPKSVCRVFDLKRNHEYEIWIEKWMYTQKRWFFQDLAHEPQLH